MRINFIRINHTDELHSYQSYGWTSSVRFIRINYIRKYKLKLTNVVHPFKSYEWTIFVCCISYLQARSILDINKKWWLHQQYYWVHLATCARGGVGRRNRKKKDARAVVVAVGTKIGGRRRPYGHCSFIYVIRVNDIFAISPYVLVAQQK